MKPILTKRNYIVLCKSLLVLAILGVLIWGCLSPRDVTIYTHEPFTTLDQDWTQTQDPNTQSITIERTITADMAGLCILFYAEHQTVSATVANQLVYHLTCQYPMLATPGRTWVKIPIATQMVGQTLRLTFQSPFTAYQTLPSHVYCVAENAIYAVQMDWLLLRNTAAFLMLVLAAVSYVNAILWKQKQMRRFLFSLADLYFFIGLWLCAQVNVLSIWFGRGIISTVLALLLALMIPVAFYHFFISILPYTSWRTRLAGGLVWGNVLVSLTLQCLFGVPLLQLTFLHMVVIVSACLLGLVEIGFYHGSRMQFLAYNHACYWSALLFLAGLMECFIQLHYHDLGQWMGVPICLACLVYYIITHIFLVSTHSTTAQEKMRLEQAFDNLHKQPLNQQINAHFLYNSLNTISSYCKEDSPQAYEAIRLLGQYMRAYTQLLGANDYVDLEEELDLMQTYMAIQNLRFEHSIQFHVRNTCDDVLLPPLTLQPLVENAVNHAIRKGDGSGSISITTCYKYNMAEIVVRDDGVGFDVETLKTTKGVGLGNLERRIQAMGGHLTVESTPGKGTAVILMVPINTQEDNDLDHFICG